MREKTPFLLTQLLVKTVLAMIMLEVLEMPVIAGQPPAILKNGEVWLKTQKSREVQITHTERNIDKLEISPSNDFAAAYLAIGHYEQEDDIENPTSYSLKSIYSILILDLKNGNVVANLKSPKAILHPIGWQSDDSYLYGEGSAHDIYQEYQYEPKTGETKLLNR